MFWCIVKHGYDSYDTAVVMKTYLCKGARPDVVQCKQRTVHKDGLRQPRHSVVLLVPLLKMHCQPQQLGTQRHEHASHRAALHTMTA
jgi:hypothetical protein